MATFLKRRIDQAQSEAADLEVRQTVESIITDIGRRGDRAVRELSEKFDRWSPSSFRLSKKEIDGFVRQVPEGTLDDIRFAQEQIRTFAHHQKAALRDVEVEIRPGVKLGHKNIPVDKVMTIIIRR